MAKAIGGILVAMMFTGAFLAMGMMDSDPVFAVRLMAACLSPALLVLVCTILAAAGRTIRRLWRAYVAYSREQAVTSAEMYM